MASDHRSRILVLEDEPLLARLVAQILSREGHEVEVCLTPVESERYWRKAGDGIDLMIVGRMLQAGRSGVEIGRAWQRREPGLPVIVLDRHPPSRTHPPDSGSDLGLPLIVPPFVPGEIVRHVAELLEASQETVSATLDPDEAPSPGAGASSPGGSTLTH